MNVSGLLEVKWQMKKPREATLLKERASNGDVAMETFKGNIETVETHHHSQTSQWFLLKFLLKFL